MKEVTIYIPEIYWVNSNGKHELREIRIKHKGIWDFHKYDKDTFPSNPHGHNLETGEKLNIYTGKKYNPSTRKVTGWLKKKQLSRIQDEARSKGLSF